MSYNRVVLLLGSNINFPKKNIDTAIGLIISNVGRIIAKSSKMDTIPVEFDSKNIFCNIALLIHTVYSPMELLCRLKKIERSMGREVDSAEIGEYQDRIIDIDVVYYNEMRFWSQKLKIPHLKHINDREFSKKLIRELNIKI